MPHLRCPGAYKIISFIFEVRYTQACHNTEEMWNWGQKKIEVSPLIEQNLKHFCSNNMSDDEHKFQSVNLVRNWLRDSSDDVLLDVRNARVEIGSSSFPRMVKNSLDQQNLRHEHQKSTSKFDVNEELSRLSKSGTEHERIQVAPNDTLKETVETKISCFPFWRTK